VRIRRPCDGGMANSETGEGAWPTVKREKGSRNNPTVKRKQGITGRETRHREGCCTRKVRTDQQWNGKGRELSANSETGRGGSLRLISLITLGRRKGSLRNMPPSHLRVYPGTERKVHHPGYTPMLHTLRYTILDIHHLVHPEVHHLVYTSLYTLKYTTRVNTSLIHLRYTTRVNTSLIHPEVHPGYTTVLTPRVYYCSHTSGILLFSPWGTPSGTHPEVHPVVHTLRYTLVMRG